jgi:hypothetical protein
VEDDTALKCDIADCNGGDLDSINKAWDDLVETKDFSRWEWSLYDYETAEGPADIEDVMQIFGGGGFDTNGFDRNGLDDYGVHFSRVHQVWDLDDDEIDGEICGKKHGGANQGQYERLLLGGKAVRCPSRASCYRHRSSGGRLRQQFGQIGSCKYIPHTIQYSIQGLLSLKLCSTQKMKVLPYLSSPPPAMPKIVH